MNNKNKKWLPFIRYIYFLSMGDFKPNVLTISFYNTFVYETGLPGLFKLVVLILPLSFEKF